MSSYKRKPNSHQLLSKKWQVILLFFAVLLMFTLMSAISHWAKELDRQEMTHQAFMTSKQSKTEVDYQPVLPHTSVDFDNYFNEHPTFHQEVWRFKANVKGDDGQEYGIQWALYRMANGDHQANGWQNAQVYTAQVIISNKDKVWTAQRAARGGIGQAGVIGHPTHIWIDNWSWRSQDSSTQSNRLLAGSNQFSIDLSSSRFGPLIANGDNGYKKITESVISTPNARTKDLAVYSFSSPFVKTKGNLVLNGKKIAVQGLAWIDKEWGNYLIADETLSWDNFNIHLKDGRSLNLTQYRYAQKSFVSGTLSNMNGVVTKLEANQVHINPLETYQLSNGRFVPLRWVIEIPQYNINLITKFNNQQMWFPFWIPSWEGPISVTGSQTGLGFMQLTGY